MMCKLGDKTFKKNEQDIESNMAREDAQVNKIRELIKERNKKRGQRQRDENLRMKGMRPGKNSQEWRKARQKKREGLTRTVDQNHLIKG